MVGKRNRNNGGSSVRELFCPVGGASRFHIVPLKPLKSFENVFVFGVQFGYVSAFFMKSRWHQRVTYIQRWVD